eukprot:6328827-Pyramimonas_sp.AAC.1
MSRSRLDNLSTQQIREQKAALEPSADQWDSARKALRGWKMADDDDTCKLLLVPRRHKERVYAADVRRALAKVTEVQEDYLLRKVWLQKKCLNPEAGTTVPVKWHIDPHSLEKFPRGLKRDEVWAFDSGIAQNDLGPG